MKKLFFTYLALIFTIIFNSKSFADWTKVSVSESGNTWYVDFQTIKEHSGYVYYWELNSYLKPDKFGDWSAINYKQVDCNLLRYKFLSDTYYSRPMGQGKITASTNNPSKKWIYVNHNTIGHLVLNKVCSQ